jgi:hypothetical protein
LVTSEARPRWHKGRARAAQEHDALSQSGRFQQYLREIQRPRS